MTPTDRKYSKEHEWIMVENGVAKLGITDHAQDALGDIVFVELPAVDDEVKCGDSFAVVESVKAVSNIYSCVCGTVCDVNSALDDEPELLNSDPYGAFIAAVKVSKINDDELMDAAAYDAFVEAEG